MNINAKGLTLIKTFERLSILAYYCPAGKLTIGYGHTGADVREHMIITENKAKELLREDLKHFEKGVEEMVEVHLNENQFAALVSFAFNVGLQAFKESTLLDKLNKKDYEGAKAEFKKWIYVGTYISNGLVRRRNAEVGLFSEPV